nr:hypothetical protein [Chloroflexota bacterium]
MTFRIDGALYPDVTPPDTLDSQAEKVDFIARLCAAWDFGLLPDRETIEEIRRDVWRSTVDQCRLLTSPTYHLLRQWHDLPPLPFLGSIPAYINDDPNLAFV